MTESPHQKLEHLRKQACWSQEELALKAGISVRTVRRAENGEKVSEQTWKDVASAFTAAGYPIDFSDFIEATVEGKPSDASTPRTPPQVDIVPVGDGKTFFNMLAGSHAYSVDADDADDPEIADLVKEILGAIEYREIWDDLTPDRRYDAQMEVSKTISKLNGYGWGVCCVRRTGTFVLPKAPGQDAPATIPGWVTVTFGVKNLNATFGARLKDPAFLESVRKNAIEAGIPPEEFEEVIQWFQHSEFRKKCDQAAREIGISLETFIKKVGSLSGAGPEFEKRFHELASSWNIEPQKLMDVVSRALGPTEPDESCSDTDDSAPIAN